MIHALKQSKIKETPIFSYSIFEIQNQLQAKKCALFDEHIVSTNTSTVMLWIKNKYPELIYDSDDILRGVFRRTRNELLNFDLKKRAWKTDDILIRFAEIECKSVLPTEENKNRNLGLTKAEFKQLVQKLNDGDETLIEKVYLAHFDKCILILVSKTGCTKEQANDSCIDALLEIRSDLMKDKIMYGNLQSYFTTRAIKKYYKTIRKKSIDTTTIEDDLAIQDHFDTEEDLQERDLKLMVKNAIEKLCDECRYILKQVYYEEANMNEISIKMNKSHDAIRKQASRCRKKLKDYISESFYNQFATYFK